MSVLNRLSRYLLSPKRGNRAKTRSRQVLPGIESLEGRAVPAAIATPPIFQNPFMAPNNVSEIHLNSYQTDTFSIPGPGTFGRPIAQQALLRPPVEIGGTIAFNQRGQILTIRSGPDPRRTGSNAIAQNLLLLTPDRLRVLAQISLPSRAQSGNTVSFGGGGYFYLDNLDRVVCVTAANDIRIYSVVSTGPRGLRQSFFLSKRYDLSSVITESGDILNSVLPDNVGNLWFISNDGVVGYVNPATGTIRSTTLAHVPGANPNETNTKSFATDGQGGVFVVSDYALYRFQVGSDGKPRATWRTTYDRGTRVKPGQTQQGSGTTPTLFDDFAGNQFVAIADNADPFLHVNVYNRRTGALVAQQAVFSMLPNLNATENSLIAVNHSIVVENNYGNVNPTSTLGRRTTEPGVARVDFDPGTGRSRVAWTNTTISVPSVVSQLSTADGLEYTYAKDARGWYWAALDFRTGAIVAVSRVRLSNTLGGVLANNFYGGLTIGPDGSAYTGVFGGIVVWRPRLHRP